MSAASASAASAAPAQDARVVKLILKPDDKGNMVTVEAPYSVVERSKVILAVIAEDKDEDEMEVPLPNVSASTMQLVLEYLTHHAVPGNREPVIPKPLPSDDPAVFLKAFPWDREFIQRVLDTQVPENNEDGVLEYVSDGYAAFYDLCEAARYLDIESLFNLATSRFAAMLKNKTPDEIRAHFGIPTPTAEQQDEVKKANKWINDVKPNYVDVVDGEVVVPAAAGAGAAPAAAADDA